MSEEEEEAQDLEQAKKAAEREKLSKRVAENLLLIKKHSKGEWDFLIL